jgi:poly-gamma-glutamate capsule biosynthesis protein CapA/YwtB (metallophosphatase superfamily)
MSMLKRLGVLGVVVAIAGAVAFAQAGDAGLAGAAPPVARAAASPLASAAAAPLALVAAATTSTPATPTPSVTVAAVGDMLFDASPRRLIASAGGKAPLVYVAKSLRSADLTIGNLENPLSNRGAAVSGKPAHLIFEGDPRAVKGLSASGFDIVALANNHMMDHRKVALADTLKTLNKAGIAHAGAGMNTTAAWKPAIVVRNGARIAFLSFSDNVPDGFTPSKSRPGVAIGRNMKKVTKAIRSAKKKADYVVVSFHWGVEQSYTANSQQVRDARAAVRAGADMVLSHHPHVVQGFEFYRHKLIAYSLGNFVFPYKTIEGRKSVILRASLTPSGVTSVTVTPVYLGEYGRPKPVTGSLARSILKRVKTTSAKRGTKVVISGNKARLKPH